MIKKENITLIGMPGAGKSTIGVLLAKSVLKSFVDTDLIIQQEIGRSLCQIIEEDGTESFLETENRIIFSRDYKNSVIATGGGAVYGKEAMEKLREISTVIYLCLPVEEIEKRISNIHTRGVAMKNGVTLKELFCERAPLYEKYAHLILDCTKLTAEECVDRITEMIK